MNKKFKYKKRITLAILLCLLVSLIIGLSNKYFCHVSGSEYMRMGGFAKEKRESIDVVCIGASEIVDGYSPAVAYKEYGITSYPYAVAAAPVSLYKTMIKNVLETQSPKLFIIELSCATVSEQRLYDKVTAHYVIDQLGYERKGDAISEALGVNVGLIDRLEYYFPFLQFHGAIHEFPDNLKNTVTLDSCDYLPLRGSYTRADVYSPNSYFELESTDEIVPIPQKDEEELVEFLEWCKETEINNILFVRYPAVIEKENDNRRYEVNCQCDYAGEIVKKYGFEYINLQYQTEEAGISFESDFCDYAHLNLYGQKKITEYLCDYISDHYGITRSEIDEDVRMSWDETVEYYDIYYNYVDSRMGNGEEVYDSYDFIKYLKQQREQE